MKKLRHIAILLAFLAAPHAFAQTAGMQLESVVAGFEQIAKSNAYVENLSNAAHNVLPIGVRRVINNMEVTIAVDKAVFMKDYTEISVYAKAILPQNNKTLFFGARGIKLSHDGSIIGDARLTLLQNIEIPFNNGNMSVVLLGDYNDKTGLSQSKTYMSIDCFGFKELGLEAELRFPQTLLKKTDDGGVVAGHFSTVVEDWNDILAEISLPRFEIVGLDGFVFDVQNAVFDFSDIHNSQQMRFPAGYEQKYGVPGAATLWRGVWVQKLEVTLPKALGGSEPTRFSAGDLIVDNNGISGLFAAENLLTFEKGNASGWNFSIDTFKLQLEANKLVGAGFGGELGLPFVGEKTRLGYDAIIREGNDYQMTVRAADSLDFSIFNAKATILPNSRVTMRVVDDQLRPEAILHGSMTVDTGAAVAAGEEGGNTPVKIPTLEFRNLCLRTEAPYISIETLGYSGKVTLGAGNNFGLSLANLALRTVGDKGVELASDAKIALGGDMFAGDTHLVLKASMQDVDGRGKWQFDGVELSAIGVEASIANTIDLKGEVVWHRDDPTYGDGFYGDFAVRVKPVGLDVDMRGAFGSVDDFKYWFIDGGVKLPGGGIPVAGPLRITGFAGAVSQRMVGQGTAPDAVSAFTSSVYVPDKSRGLGLKASVMLDVGTVASGEACFDIAFSARGGLSFIGFYGYAQFASGTIKIDGVDKLSAKYREIQKAEQMYAKDYKVLEQLKQTQPNKAAEMISPMPKDASAAIMGSLGIQYDFTNKTFHAQTELFLNTPGGFLRGTGENGRAGWGVIHIAPEEWYMHLGSPNDRIGVMLSLGNILNIRTGSYLMAGSRIPAMPAPPQQVADILGMELSQLTIGRNIDLLNNGRGFAFGSDFAVKTGDIQFLILYANFAAGLGFDIMLKDYGEMECRETGNQVGIDGWYAMGQAYAYLQGELGVKVNLWLLKAKFPIISGGAATLLQAGLPRPAFFRGYLGVKFNILGGLVKGNMRFKLSLGDECTPVMPGGSPLQMPMISDVAPSNDESDVSVFTVPQAAFNTAVGTQFDAEDDSGMHTYRIGLRSFTVKTEDGAEVIGTLKWNAYKNAVSFQPKEILPPNTVLIARAEVGFERLNGNTWEIVKTSGQDAIESKQSRFTTGGAPENIPLENVVYCYPVVDQQYFLTQESSKGFVQLQFGQKYLFEKGFDYKLKFGDVPADFTYNEAENRLEFTIPQLEKNRTYTMSLSYTVEEGAQKQAQQQTTESDDGTVTVTNRSAQAEISAGEKSVLKYKFATSRHGNFAQKIGSFKTEGNGVMQDAGGSFRLLYDVSADEAFDQAEVFGVTHSGSKALVRPTAELGEPFFTVDVIPLVYADYPFGGIRLANREDEEIGVPPVRSVFAYEPYRTRIAEGAKPTGRFILPFSYETGIVAEKDFRDLLHQIANNREGVPDDIYRRFMTGKLPFLHHGKYKVVLHYTLPDGTVTSSHVFYFNNFLKQ